MTQASTNILLAFFFSLLGTLIFRSHLMSTLLCLEGMMLTLFIMSTMTALNSQSTVMYTIPIVMLVFAACEAAIGLALLAMISNTYGTDYVQNLNLLQC
uniref:NADH-ubiquinone oxidoreductase chain 4L n=2 Tax=Calomys TaxID=29105 RepID=NU4LM_CALLC|nr:RecName: Full=NADH-ubiquinone oxidoreductase chain 4L; AltName: Full=NADH dehydrogenase subunit 4L [Calomys laucha]Q7GF83.1 RecName: Full=NADH-ubiquinone oxidoreductase chain 4L; AltName: Full=NADH dehydrogenase subunit 4L [Calomys musculinus]AAB87170.1 NADH dehydrogenase subunit 4L [Calomys laucha]AAB87173.1 NADH dehydrogenase subunit 4L [Calomys musculinus]